MVVVGGLGSLPGAITGAFLLTIAPELLRTAGHFRMVMVGALLFGAILLFPKGLSPEERFLAWRPLASSRRSRL
jgi:branched-chain amino acid transport system permease protein